MKHQRGRFFPLKKANPKMFEITDDDYCLKPEQWYQLSADMEASAPTFPAAFSDKIKRIDRYISTWRASDWKNWVCLFAPIFLHDRLSDYDYYYFDLLSETMILTTSCSIFQVNLVIIYKNLIIFIKYYE